MFLVFIDNWLKSYTTMHKMRSLLYPCTKVIFHMDKQCVVYYRLIIIVMYLLLFHHFMLVERPTFCGLSLHGVGLFWRSFMDSSFCGHLYGLMILSQSCYVMFLSHFSIGDVIVAMYFN